jgi:hypothetical protein
MRRLSQTQERKQRRKKRKRNVCCYFFHIYKSLENHCQNRSQNVLPPDDDDVEEKCADCNGIGE